MRRAALGAPRRSWYGEVSDFDRYLAGLDPRQMHFSFHAEPCSSGAGNGDAPLPTEDSEPLLSVAIATRPDAVDLKSMTYEQI
jgi:hypothetical protein